MIENWRVAWKFWSLQLQGAGLALLAFPELLVGAWLQLPDEIKTMMPVEYSDKVGIALIALGMIARLIKQRKLNETKVST